MKGYIAQQTVGGSGRMTVVRYAGALFAVTVGVLLGLWLEPLVDATVLLLIAVLVAAWFSGLWPALLASLIATLALAYFFTAPLYTFTLEIGHIPHLLMFTLIAGLFATASAARRSAERSLTHARDELDAKVQGRGCSRTRALSRSRELGRRHRVGGRRAYIPIHVCQSAGRARSRVSSGPVVEGVHVLEGPHSP
jgi:K+-sensing histidine kinase KdpD